MCNTIFILYWKDVKTANICFIVLGNLLGNFVTNLNVFRMSYNHNAFRNQYPKPRALHNGYNILRGVIYAYKKNIHRHEERNLSVKVQILPFTFKMQSLSFTGIVV